jgi:hypothetical protein
MVLGVQAAGGQRAERRQTGTVDKKLATEHGHGGRHGAGKRSICFIVAGRRKGGYRAGFVAGALHTAARVAP